MEPPSTAGHHEYMAVTLIIREGVPYEIMKRYGKGSILVVQNSTSDSEISRSAASVLMDRVLGTFG